MQGARMRIPVRSALGKTLLAEFFSPDIAHPQTRTPAHSLGGVPCRSVEEILR